MLLALALPGLALVAMLLGANRAVTAVACGLGVGLAAICLASAWQVQWPASRRQLLSFGLTAVGYLAVVAAFILAPTTKKTDEDGDGGGMALPADLDLVPRDAAYFFAIRVADTWGSDDAKGMRDAVKANQQAQMSLEGMKALSGLGIEDIERAVGVGLKVGPGEMPVGLVTTVKPYDRDKVLGFLGPEKQEKKVGDKTLYTSPMAPVAVHLVNERTLMVGQAKDVETLLQRAPAKDAKGPLTDALREAANKHTFAAGFHSTALPPDAKKDVPELYKPLFDAQSVGLTFDAGKDKLELGTRLTFASEEEAKKAEEPIKQALRAAQQVVNQGLDLVPKMAPPKDPGVEKLMKLMDDTITGLQKAFPKVEGKVVRTTVTVKTPDPLSALAGAAPMLMGAMGPPGPPMGKQ
jgi:hypothetical protein